MSYNEIPNILVDSISLPNKPLSNLELIDDAKWCLCIDLEEYFRKKLFLRKQNQTNVVF